MYECITRIFLRRLHTVLVYFVDAIFEWKISRAHVPATTDTRQWMDTLSLFFFCFVSFFVVFSSRAGHMFFK